MNRPGAWLIQPKAQRQLAVGLWLFTAGGMIAPLAISPPPLTQAIWAFAYAAIPTAGAFIVLKRPSNRIGWLLLSTGPIAAVGMLGQSFARVGIGSGSAWGAYSLLVGSTALMASVYVLSFVPLRFPDGSLPSPRWKVVELLGSVGAGAAVVGAFFVPGVIEPINFPGVENPISFAGSTVVGNVLSFGALLWLVAAVAMVASAVVRFRKARGDERQQLKWLSIAVIWFALWMVLFLTNILPIGATPFFGTVNAVLLAAAIAIAVLKYRLYDIDVVISKTLVFAGLAGFITAIYVGIVVGLGTLLGAGDEPNLALSIVATAVVAVAFQPVRERLTRVANRLVFGKRATPYEVLSGFSEHLAEVADPQATLERMARLLVDGTGAARAQVWLDTPGGLQPAVTWPTHATDTSQPEHLVEVAHEGQVLGALSVDKQRGETLSPTDVKLVDDLGAQAGLVLRNLRLTDELRQKIVDLQASRQRLVAAQDAERRRLERDLHDGAQLQLTALKQRIAGAAGTAETEKADRAAQILEQVTADADDAIETLRELAHGIYPPLLGAEGLAGALRAQATKAAVPVVVETDGIGRHPQDIEAAVYFCVLEAIQNAAKYANPSQVTIRLAQTDGQLTFEVTDDGTGFDPADTPRGAGTTNMTDRLDALNGQLEILSAPGMGTTVAGQLPVVTSEVAS